MIVRILPLATVPDESLAYAVLGARVAEGWIFVRHRDRATWEMPGGHRESGEPIEETARRELYEETGCAAAELRAVCDYSVLREGDLSYGRLFWARIEDRGALPAFEIAQTVVAESPTGALTYPAIQPLLMERLAAFTP